MTTPASNSPAERKPASVKDFLAMPAYKGRFEEIMGKRAPQFMASITNYVTQSRQVADCEPRSVIASAFVAATLDLPIDKNLGFAWIVPYAGKAQFQMGFRGYVQLALRTGQYKTMNARAINKEAFIGYDKMTGEPEIDWSKVDEDKPAIGYAVTWKLVNGFTKCAFWTKAKVEAHAQRYSQAFRKKKADSPWVSHFDQMAKKTVLANELKAWGILSVEMRTAIEHDQGSQDDIDADVVHDDGTGLFDLAADDTLEGAATGTASQQKAADKQEPPTPPAADKKAKGDSPVSADKRKLVDQISDLTLDLEWSETKLIGIVANNKWEDVAGIKNIASFSVSTLTFLLNYCHDAKAIRDEAQPK